MVELIIESCDVVNATTNAHSDKNFVERFRDMRVERHVGRQEGRQAGKKVDK
jgi:hypothetical protein